MNAVKLWDPPQRRVLEANITAFTRRLEATHGVAFTDYEALWRWSHENPKPFWRAVWDDGGVIGTPGERVVVAGAALSLYWIDFNLYLAALGLPTSTVGAVAAVASLALSPLSVLPFFVAMLAGMAAHNILPEPGLRRQGAS